MKKDNKTSLYDGNTSYLGEDKLYEEKTVLRHSRRSAFRVFFIAVGLVIAFLLLYFAAKAFFKVEDFSVSGNGKYTLEEITDACGIETGDFMFTFASSDVESRICRYCPYVKSAEVRREYPSTVIIEITEYDARYLTQQMDKYIVFSPELKVLEVSDENKWGEKLIDFEIPKISKAIEGNIIEFAGLSDARYITDFIISLDEFESDEKIDKAVLTDSFIIKMSCGGRFAITLGKYDEMSVKMRTLTKVMKSDTVKNSVAASIDISDPKEPRVIPYDRVEGLEGQIKDQ